MSKIIVTGACGFIASHVVDLLVSQGHKVLGIDDLSTGKRENAPEPSANFETVKVNVGNWFDLVAEFVDFEPEYVIHLAAQPSIGESWDNPIRDAYSNVMGTLNVIRASQKIGAKGLVFSSTSAVYGEKVFPPVGEDDLKQPNTPYGVSKLAAETYVRMLMPDNSVVLRFGNVYGPRQVPIGENQVVPRMIRHFEKGDEFYIHGDGNQERDMVYVGDVSRACANALEGDTGIYNIASGVGHTVNFLAKVMADIYEIPDYAWQHDDKTDPRRIVMNIDNAKVGLNWMPTTDIYNGLKETVEWWKKQ